MSYDYKCMNDFIFSDSERSEEDREALLNSMRASIENAMRIKLNVNVVNLGLEEQYKNAFTFVGEIRGLPKPYRRPTIIIWFNNDSSIWSNGNCNGYLSAAYNFEWFEDRGFLGREKSINLSREMPYYLMHLRIKDYQVEEVHLNKAGFVIDEDEIVKLLLPSRKIEQWYERYETFGPALDAKTSSMD